MARAGSADLPDGESGIFLREVLDRKSLICPSGRIGAIPLQMKTYVECAGCCSSTYLCANHDDSVAGTKPTMPYRKNCSAPESGPREP